MQAQPKTQKLIERRGSFRVALSTPYRWKFRLQQGFFDAVVSELGECGMFVNTDNPEPEGSEIDFEVQCEGMGRIEGRGEVTWVCYRSSGSGHAPGMGIRFVDLRGDSQEVVRSAVEERLQAVEPSFAH